MISLDISALETIDSTHGLSAEELEAESKNIEPFLKKIHDRNQGFYSDEVLKNEELVGDILAYKNQIKGKYDHIVVLGIGGSALGAICLKEAFGNLFTGTTPQLHVLDNIDPDLLQECLHHLSLQKTLFVVITKSGGTPETLSQYFFFREKIIAANLLPQDHFVFITDPKKGFLREEAAKENIRSFPVPPNVGGRFSVLTAVGLLPAALIGIDIHALLQGAQEMRAQFLFSQWEENVAFQLATIQYLLSQKRKSIHVMMPYAQKLYRLVDWYRQLLAESIGKKENEKGEVVHAGITPVNALGVTDQHSQSQLYMEGPNDKLFCFLEVENFENNPPIPLPYPADDRVNFLENTTFSRLLQTEKKATAEALTHNDRPHITILIDSISAENIGGLFLLFEGSIAFLGEYFSINAFDQPGVELSKNLTKTILLNKR